jgi:hypothetical protein
MPKSAANFGVVEDGVRRKTLIEEGEDLPGRCSHLFLVLAFDLRMTFGHTAAVFFLVIWSKHYFMEGFGTL